MTNINATDSSFTRTLKRFRLPWYAAAVLVAVLFFGFSYLVTYLDGLDYWEVMSAQWRSLLSPPTIILYVVVAHPFIDRLEKQSLQSTVQLVRQTQEYKDQLLKKLMDINPLHETLAALLGMGIIILLGQPWRTAHTWFDGYLITSQALMFGILSWLIYGGLHGARNVTRLSRLELDLDLFRLEALAPVARWSLGVSFGFIGGISISLLFQKSENLLQWPTMLVYVILVSAAVSIFFISMRGIHYTIIKIKRQELTKAQEKLTGAYRKLRELTGSESGESTGMVYSEVMVWWVYERQVREVREWPYDNGIIRRLAVSIISPAVIYLLKLFFGIDL